MHEGAVGAAENTGAANVSVAGIQFATLSGLSGSCPVENELSVGEKLESGVVGWLGHVSSGRQ